MNRRIAHRRWRSAEDFDTGSHDGTAVDDGVLALKSATRIRHYTDPHRDQGAVAYEQASWTSPEVSPGFLLTDLIPSWNASTPPGSWVEVEIAVTMDDGSRTGWYALGRWAETDQDIHPTSVPGQDDHHARVKVDVLTATCPCTVSSYRLRVNLLRRLGSDVTPAVSLLGVTASDVQAGHAVDRSGGGSAFGRVLDVPAYSQQLHRGEHPQWALGGESWCSPTATSMVLGYWGRGPRPEDYPWVAADHQDGFVDYAARHVFDHSYNGAGNWSFNTAYAARFGLTAYVTRMRSMAEAEQFIAAGIPLVVSVTFTEEQLDGAGYGTAGHLLTIIGFDADGNVVSNDPASHQVASNDEVRTTYDRRQFEDAWLARTGGIAYVIHPPDVTPPPPPPEPTW